MGEAHIWESCELAGAAGETGDKEGDDKAGSCSERAGGKGRPVSCCENGSGRSGDDEEGCGIALEGTCGAVINA